MAVWGRSFFAVLLILGMLHCAAAATYIVGGTSNDGWTFQSNDSFYDDQFKDIPLFVNDRLTFSFIEGAHNVFVVSEADLKKCDGSNPISEYNATTTITLTTAGFHGFICEIPTHCSLSGMHLSVTVQASGGPEASPSPGTPSAPGPGSPGAPPPGAASTIRSGLAMVVGAVMVGIAAMLL